MELHKLELKVKMITKEQLVENVFKKYQDPEVGIDVWTMGLIYEIKIEGKKQDLVKVKMTFTSPMCPLGPMMIEDITEMIKKEGAEKVEIEIVFDPPWQPSEELKEMLEMI